MILTDADKSFLIRLKSYRKILTAQQYKTLNGQVLAGDTDGERATKTINKKGLKNGRNYKS